jgi:hypothetical protein
VDDILAIAILIFLFWGTPDNWDKLDAIIGSKYAELQFTPIVVKDK